MLVFMTYDYPRGVINRNSSLPHKILTVLVVERSHNCGQLGQQDRVFLFQSSILVAYAVDLYFVLHDILPVCTPFDRAELSPGEWWRGLELHPRTQAAVSAAGALTDRA